jgi:FAD/FMN-containing dehydrogenase/Fe-S oxidoreductase
MNIQLLQNLANSLQGEFYYDQTMRTLYATDASAYREMPLAVALPKTEDDILKLINFAREHKTSLIPRTAGTSLAGQVVGKGIVVDVSKYFTKILEINEKENWVKVQPGVIRDELNMYLSQFDKYFGPETSTANRAMIGGMVGNNSCGSNSVVYGSTREHTLEVTGFLSDGTKTTFSPLTPYRGNNSPLQQAAGLTPPVGGWGAGLLGEIYANMFSILSNPENQAEIRKEFPKSSIPRRNTGYAIDLLLETKPFTPESTEEFNLAKLVCGSEGTLMFLTEIKLNIVPKPPKNAALLCIHCHSIDESLRANLVALKYNPSACELIDHYILECTKTNREQLQNRFFVEGDPQALLVVEIAKDDKAEVEKIMTDLIADLKTNNFGFHYPILWGEDCKKVWTLRKAGLGLLSNIKGDAKPVCVVEDTAVDVQDLPEYIREFNEILKKHDMYSVHYAHAGSGELHLRPIINLKTEEGNQQFRTIATEVAHLVKKYKGSLSGEHGDGRLRGEFISLMVGAKNYELLKAIKRTWDKDNIFNPNKIVDTPPMNESLRYNPKNYSPQPPNPLQGGTDVNTSKTPPVGGRGATIFNFDDGMLRATELCNGSGDCRKTELSGGTMCPSFMATRNEKDTTRARANILREYLTHSESLSPQGFETLAGIDGQTQMEEVKQVMDLCLSCKGCKSECPSNVDLAKLKAEFMHHYYEKNGVPLRSQLIANFTASQELAMTTPRLYNFLITNSFTSNIIKGISGFATKRSMPKVYKTTLKKWFEKNPLTPEVAPQPPTGGAKFTIEDSGVKTPPAGGRGAVYLFADEFTNYNDVEMGITAIKLLQKLGYEVIIPTHVESGRTYLSKGLLKNAKKLATENVELLKDKITEETPLIGLEPSAILTFRDEYLDLVNDYQKPDAQRIAKNALLIDEFLAREIDKGNITKAQFTTEKRLIKLHGHCHQKALASLTPTKKVLEFPQNYEVHLIRSGCCGMAGSFGYEKEHYEVSMQVGELVLFPTVRQQPENVIIAANGTSCRHQIKDGTGRVAKHLVEILWEGLK